MTSGQISRGGTPGDRIAQARRESGLTQKTLAAHLDVPLWVVEELESGRRDVTPHLDAIAGLTDRPRSWFGGEAIAPPRVRAARGLAGGRKALDRSTAQARPAENGHVSEGRLRRARQEAGLTAKQLADELGLSLWNLEQLEAGAPNESVPLAAAARATGKPVEWFHADDRIPTGTDRPQAGEGRSGRGREARGRRR